MKVILQLFSRLWRFIFSEYGSRTPISFGEALGDIRAAKRFSQERVCRRINICFTRCGRRSIARDTISHWENNRRIPKSFKVTEIDLIADALKCSDQERAKLHLSFLYTVWVEYQNG